MKCENGDELLAYHRVLLAHFFLCVTPSILSLFQGSEFFEPASFAENPSNLDIPTKVGVFDGTSWSSQGEYSGFFNVTRKLITMRHQYMVWMLSEDEF